MNYVVLGMITLKTKIYTSYKIYLKIDPHLTYHFVNALSVFPLKEGTVRVPLPFLLARVT